jgi:hypothetical protein
MCPSLSSSSPLDQRIKNMLMNDVFHLVGFTPDDPCTAGDPAAQSSVDLLLKTQCAGEATAATVPVAARSIAAEEITACFYGVPMPLPLVP